MHVLEKLGLKKCHWSSSLKALSSNPVFVGFKLLIVSLVIVAYYDLEAYCFNIVEIIVFSFSGNRCGFGRKDDVPASFFTSM